MYKRLMFLVFVLAGLISLIAQENDSLPEKYVPKVIIEAEWGDGPGEFGVDLQSSPPSGPGNLSINENEDIFIYDCDNDRISQYDSCGQFVKSINLENNNINNFTVRNDTIFAITSQSTPSEVKQELKLIDVKTGKDIKDLEFPFSVSKRTLSIKKKNGNILISRKTLFLVNEKPRIQEKVFKLAEVSGKRNDDTLDVKEIRNAKEKLKKLDESKGELIIGGQKLLISNPKGTALLNAEKLAADRDGNLYISVWSNNPVGSPKPRVFEEVFKFSSTGNKLAVVNIPLSEKVGGDGERSIQVSNRENIYYLYPTGKIIQQGWELKFIPGKVQVIKWELQK